LQEAPPLVLAPLFYLGSGAFLLAVRLAWSEAHLNLIWDEKLKRLVDSTDAHP